MKKRGKGRPKSAYPLKQFSFRCTSEEWVKFNSLLKECNISDTRERFVDFTEYLECKKDI
jgi:hypothetical protein